MNRYDSLGIYKDLNKKMLWFGLPPMYLLGILLVQFVMFAAIHFYVVFTLIILYFILKHFSSKAKGSSTDQGDPNYYSSVVNYNLNYKRNFTDSNDVFILIKHFDDKGKLKNKSKRLIR